MDNTQNISAALDFSGMIINTINTQSTINTQFPTNSIYPFPQLIICQDDKRYCYNDRILSMYQDSSYDCRIQRPTPISKLIETNTTFQPPTVVTYNSKNIPNPNTPFVKASTWQLHNPNKKINPNIHPENREYFRGQLSVPALMTINKMT